MNVSYCTVKASVSLSEYRAVLCQAIHTRIICSVRMLGRSSKALDSIKHRNPRVIGCYLVEYPHKWDCNGRAQEPFHTSKMKAR